MVAFLLLFYVGVFVSLCPEVAFSLCYRLIPVLASFPGYTSQLVPNANYVYQMLSPITDLCSLVHFFLFRND